VTTLLQVLHFARRYAPDPSFVALDTYVHWATAWTRSPVLRLAGLVFPASRRDLVSVVWVIEGAMQRNESKQAAPVRDFLFVGAPE